MRQPDLDMDAWHDRSPQGWGHRAFRKEVAGQQNLPGEGQWRWPTYSQITSGSDEGVDGLRGERWAISVLWPAWLGALGDEWCAGSAC